MSVRVMDEVGQISLFRVFVDKHFANPSSTYQCVYSGIKTSSFQGKGHFDFGKKVRGERDDEIF